MKRQCALNKQAVDDRVQVMQDAIESNEPAVAMRSLVFTLVFADTVQDCAESLYNQRKADIEEIRNMLKDNELVSKFVDQSVFYKDQFNNYVVKVQDKINMDGLRERILSQNERLRSELAGQLELMKERVRELEIQERLQQTPDVVLISLRRAVDKVNQKLAEIEV